MPAVSKAARKAFAIAEHHPEDLYARNRDLLKMGKSKLHEFASTQEKGLPYHKGVKKMYGKRHRPKRE